jgi:hypothetical protein
MANLARAIRKADRDGRKQQAQSRRNIRQMWRRFGL